MAGTAKNLDGTKILLGPCSLWANVAVPAGGARMTIHTDGTPESVANPNAKHLGMTVGGGTFTVKPNIQNFESDELTSPHLSKIISEDVMIEAELIMLADLTDILQYVWPGGNYSTASGYKQITGGGTEAITFYSFALICPTVADATKFHVIQLYKAFNQSGINATATRKDQGKMPLQLKGHSIATRTAGDQAYNYWIST